MNLTNQGTSIPDSLSFGDVDVVWVFLAALYAFGGFQSDDKREEI